MADQRQISHIIAVLLGIFIMVAEHRPAWGADGQQYEAPFDSTAAAGALTFTLAGGISLESFIDRYALHAEGRVGVMLGERWTIEGYYRPMLDRFSKQVIFPEVYELRLWTAGVSARHDFLSRKRYAVFAAINGGAGRASWHPKEQPTQPFTDLVYQAAPEVGASWKVWPFLALECAVRYNTVFDFELVGLESNALEGLAVGVRIRFINRRRV